MYSPRLFLKLCQESAERFWARFPSRPPDECWPWPGSNDGKSGYGRFKIRSRWSAPTHRVAYAITNGEIPDGMDVCHRCDNPPCCNPAHLYLGTHAENMADKIRKGRGRTVPQAGEANPRAKLTQAQAIEIKALIRDGKGNTEIAALYPISGAMVSRIRLGKAWVLSPALMDESYL